jgi:hypothetical protein
MKIRVLRRVGGLGLCILLIYTTLGAVFLLAAPLTLKSPELGNDGEVYSYELERPKVKRKHKLQLIEFRTCLKEGDLALLEVIDKQGRIVSAAAVTNRKNKSLTIRLKPKDLKQCAFPLTMKLNLKREFGIREQKTVSFPVFIR